MISKRLQTHPKNPRRVRVGRRYISRLNLHSRLGLGSEGVGDISLMKCIEKDGIGMDRTRVKISDNTLALSLSTTEAHTSQGKEDARIFRPGANQTERHERCWEFDQLQEGLEG